MKIKAVFILIFMSLALFGCNNFFHELIPGDGDRIVYFNIPGQLYSEIGNDSITITITPGTMVNSVIPSVQVSKDATLFPVTFDYVSRAFGDERTFGAAMQIYAGGNMTDNAIEMIRNNNEFTRPVLDLPINFNFPVDFLVISGQGNVRQYTVRVVVDTGEGRFNSFRFDKFFNPDLVNNVNGTINTGTKTVTVNVSYPVENIASYELIPVFETNNASVYLDGNLISSGTALLDFIKPPDSGDLSNPDYGTQEKTLILKRMGHDDAVWTLIVNFSEDPDTSRSITDFRITKAVNPLINADYMATITNSGDTGTVSVMVYYDNSKPETLRASFITPGTATVNSVSQISGFSANDFTTPLQYIVTSRVGGFTRTYTVTVNLVQASDPLPQITSFAFNRTPNTALSSNSTAVIDHKACLILIEAAYSGDTPPATLRPHFSATGTVTVNGVTQTSGTTSNNFSGSVWYTVTNPSNPTLRREYRVEVIYVQALSSVAEISTFIFYMADNPGLIADTTATINQATGAISATLLFDTPGGDRTLVPRWSAQGIVYIESITQTSGDERQFYTPVDYRVESIDGVLQKNYIVTIREVNSRIYVKQSATGRNDGTNWENAYTNISNITLFLPSMPSSILKEVWIAEGTYRTSSIFTPINTSLIGGFKGDELCLTERTDPINNRAIITGEQENGTRISQFNSPGFAESGFYSYEYLIIKNAGNGDWDGPLLKIQRANSYNPTLTDTVLIKNVEFRDSVGLRGGAIALTVNCTKIIENCSFINTSTNSPSPLGHGGAIWSNEGAITITNCTFTNTKGTSGGAMSITNATSVTINNNNFINTHSTNNNGHAIYFSGWSSSNITLNGNNYNGIPNPVYYAP